MDEARRAIRYLMPGVIFLFEVTLYVSLSYPDTVKSLAKDVKAESLGVLIAVLILTGGLGYLLGVLHHAMYSNQPFLRLYSRNYVGVVKTATKRKLLQLVDADSGNALTEPYELSEAGAWRIVSAVWNMEAEGKLKGANIRVNSLGDLAHGAGAAFVASWAALYMFSLLGFLLACWPSWYCYVLPLSLLLLHFIALHQVMTHFHTAIAKSLFMCLDEQRRDGNGQPELVSVPVWPSDLLKRKQKQ